MGSVPRTGIRSPAARRAGYARASTALALLSDRRLGALVDEAPLVGTGIGGTASVLDVEGVPVFVKRVPLTDLERRPENLRSTANLFRLPTFCHYGLGSAGGGVWREVAAHTMTTNWVLSGECDSFPLMYHWRVLPGPPRTPTADERAELDRSVAFWNGSPAVRERLDAIARSSARVVLFCEYVPQNLHEWLNEQIARGTATTDAACAMVEHNLHAGVAFMTARGLLHFDTHFGNILTDGRRLYFTDFGLATSTRFDLDPAEVDFAREHRDHDAGYAATEFVNWLVAKLTGRMDRAERVAYIRRCAEGEAPDGIAAAAAEVITRYAPIAVQMNEFYRKLRAESLTTPFPTLSGVS